MVKPGLLTTVQDLGRWNHQIAGVPVAGPMDVFSHRLANHLVGNQPDAATLEITLIGPELVAEVQLTVALCGADFDLWRDYEPVPVGTTFEVRPGQAIRFGKRHRGARAYLAIAGGGVQTVPVLGSRATHLVSHMGGVDGRAVVAGDWIPVGRATHAPANRARGLTLPSANRIRLRVVAGTQAAWFGADAWRLFTTTSFRVSPRSNRMGYRLEGPPLPRTSQSEPLSEPLAMGAIQVPSAGEPILLMADRQTAGGYPKIGYVITADLCLAGQLAPGDFVEFARCDERDAVAALIARERELMAQMVAARGGDA